ncbi:hypothetical protein BpV2_029 [Bathycoccus sp. RCC1105 virus BpV2]|nr:hypothetical protein BpV2_029 [Bathycoccus sp. RCC1105 virus BpV2]
MQEVIYISCIFGDKFTRVYKSPDEENSFFFTNNPHIKNEVTSKGWNYVYVNKPISNDLIISSLQSKYIKFLQFLTDYPQFDKEIIVYFDHKEQVTENTLKEIDVLIKNNSNKSLIIRQTPRLKTNINDEINEAMGQGRYVKNMKKTREFVERIVSSKNVSEKVRICNTGLLIYMDKQNIQGLLEDVYNTCMEHSQPECQIYWSVFSQRYKNDIKEIEWTAIKNIKRKDP